MAGHGARTDSSSYCFPAAQVAAMLSGACFLPTATRQMILLDHHTDVMVPEATLLMATWT
jgi:hypothetical protein